MNYSKMMMLIIMKIQKKIGKNIVKLCDEAFRLLELERFL